MKATMLTRIGNGTAEINLTLDQKLDGNTGNSEISRAVRAIRLLKDMFPTVTAPSSAVSIAHPDVLGPAASAKCAVLCMYNHAVDELNEKANDMLADPHKQLHPRPTPATTAHHDERHPLEGQPRSQHPQCHLAG